MAKSEWKVQSNCIAGEGTRYIAMRVLDTSEVVHSGNVEHYGEYSADREEICRLVDRLNRGEANKAVSCEDYWCERCCNFDREHIGVDACAPCRFTGLYAYAETYAKNCKGFNVPAEQPAAGREQITCKKCQHLEPVSGRIVSARCVALGLAFPVKGVRCSDLGISDRRHAEISPETFSCSCALPKEKECVRGC